jgi:hypothetical protein
MRKRVIGEGSQPAARAEEGWLDLETLALVEGGGRGWLAAGPGEQVIRLLFDEPQSLTHVRLLFEEESRGRTQEFVLRWPPDGGRTYHEVVRQQYNFSPPGTVGEEEEYRVDLGGVTALELRIIPDVSGGDARASLKQLRLA